MNKKTTTIAVLIDEVNSGYYQPLTRAVIELRRDYVFLPIFIISGSLSENPKEWDHSSAKLYSLLSDIGVDAVLLSGTLFHKIADHQNLLKSFRKKIGNRPVASISVPLPDSCCLSIDNKKAMRQVFDHLAQNHACRKYAFLTGPSLSLDAQYRLDAAKEFTAEMDGAIEMDIWQGNFQRLQAYNAVFEKIKNIETRPDVVVCANDESALGVLRACYQLKLRIPEDIMVTGFDDIEKSVYAASGLTTVHQPISECGTRGILVLRKMLAGYTMPENQVLPTSLIIRDSCGCKLKLSKKSKKASVSQMKEAVTLVREAVLDEINRDFEFPEPVRHLFKEIARSFLAALAGSKNTQTIIEHFRKVIFSFFSEHQYKRSYYHGLKKVFYSISNKIRALGVSEEVDHTCNEIFGLAGMELMEVWLKEEIGSGSEDEGFRLLFKEIVEQISLTKDYETLISLLDEQLPRADIKNFLIFYHTRSSSCPEWNDSGLRLLYCPPKFRGVQLDPSMILSKAGEASPDGLFCRPILDPVSFRGFIVTSMNEQTCTLLDHVIFSISNTLYRIFKK